MLHMPWLRRYHLLRNWLWVFAFILLLGPSAQPPTDSFERIRAYTRQIEFDYIDWGLRALGLKIGQAALGVETYISEDDSHTIVMDYLDMVARIQQAEGDLRRIYTDPNVEDVEAATADLGAELDDLYAQRQRLGPLAEAVFQSQLSATVSDLGFTPGGQPLPPVLYRSTPLPWALVVSPREVIQQEANISLQVELNVEDHVVLEGDIEAGLDMSALVVPVGGIGFYPTMIAQTTNLNWMSEVVAHEWIHNFLTLRPLGVLYTQSPELRTINETVASIAGKEIGGQLLLRYYPEFYVPPPPPSPPQTGNDEAPPGPPPEPPAFDFRAEMRETRETADELLLEGRIEEAEEYMEARRLIFWENGYQIRKLNQAYFAFYGAYADQPGGAAGEDPIGEAVRQVWADSNSVFDFVNSMSWVTSVDGLMQLAYGEANLLDEGVVYLG
ncbi:MAG: hypothetical protein DWQ07_20940 [Chloroflexi bacterium]|nr:MAG: hypothetical protein DWQ07_20940 [Chloroflexota bacterium]MBL1194552.1 hypothetical protein [Chloroflexota bacterium]NOH11840.1 hypothetical protein [Chloroflexota bacterium]